MIAIVFTLDSTYDGEIIGQGGQGGGGIASLVILHTTFRKLGNHVCKTNFATIKLLSKFSYPQSYALKQDLRGISKHAPWPTRCPPMPPSFHASQ